MQSIKKSIAVNLAIALCATIAPSQQPTPRPQVEVAAIHPSAPGLGDLGNVRIAPGRFEAHNMTIRKLIYIAYKVKASQILGGPPWLNSEHFDITATASDTTGDNFPLTLQTLLEDRFKLKLHPETREAAVYDLAIAKSGLQAPVHQARNLRSLRPLQNPARAPRGCQGKTAAAGIRTAPACVTA